jgi:uncharacterized protein with PIN domain
MNKCELCNKKVDEVQKIAMILNIVKIEFESSYHYYYGIDQEEYLEVEGLKGFTIEIKFLWKEEEEDDRLIEVTEKLERRSVIPIKLCRNCYNKITKSRCEIESIELLMSLLEKKI